MEQDTRVEPTQAEGGFDPRRLRSITDMTRSRDDRVVAGVCAGAGRYLGIDPVIVRILIATLSFFGFAGVIVYVAAWLLIPEEAEPGQVPPQSVAQRIFHLGPNEEQLRVVGLVIAVLLAIAAASNLVGGAWDTPFPYLGLVALAVFWFFVLRPRQRAERAAMPLPGAVPEQIDTSTPAHPGLYPPPPPRVRNPRHDHGRLTLTTLFACMAAIGALWAYSITARRVDAVAYLAVALGVIAVGLLVGSMVGNGRPLIPLGLLIAGALVVVAALPTPTLGQLTPTPASAADVRSTYRHGIGETVLDLTLVSDLAALDGRTVSVEQGVGSIRVIVPAGLDVDVDADVRAGEIRVLGAVRNGSRVHYAYTDPSDDGPDLRLDLSQRLGQIEVTTR